MKHHYKKIIIAFFFSLQFSFLNAQWVTIPDPNFAYYLDSLFWPCMNGNLMDTTCNQILSETYINCSGKGISDLTGIQYFDSLLWLDCAQNSLDSLPRLPNTLLELRCAVSGLTTLPSLPPNLEFLGCGGNYLTSLPSLPNTIYWFDCGFNQIDTLPALPSSLKSFYVRGNYPLHNLPALPNGLVEFYCGYHTDSLNLPPSLPDSLRIFDCYLSSFSSLPALPDSLKELNCRENLLTNLPSLPWGLEILNCAGNNITVLPALPTTLIKLYSSTNQLSYLPPLPNSLTELGCGNNPLNALPTLPPALWYLECTYNQLTSLPALPQTLKRFFCQFNQLSNIPELPDSLQDFELNDNPQLFCLPKLNTISHLKFYNTGITCLPNYGNVNISFPSLSTLPLCDLFNTNGCTAYWNISGKVYSDTNNNCIADANELRMSNFKMMLDSSGVLIQQTFTVGEGLYSFDTDTGIYIYTVDTTDLPVLVTCPASGFQTSVLTALDSMDYDMDFGMQCKPGFDVGVTSVVQDSGVFRPAQFARVKISAGDISNFYGLHCATGISGSVQVVFNGAASYIGPSAGALTPVASGDTLLYSIADFGTVNFNSDFSFVIQTDTTAVNGSQICFDVNVTPTAGDINVANNFLHYCFTVVNSVDPNTKEVFPEGNIDTSQHWLTYTINFQNTGTAPAQHIYILDTLDNNLDESSFTLLSYNHQPLTQVVGKVIRFNFPNINLPDSTSDEPNSHGYVQFKVKLKTGLTNGTLIHNTANIYFDFNQPVTTNTTENEILITTGIEGFKVSGLRFKVVPNPAHDEVNIVFSSKNKFKIEIVNAIGETLIKKQNQKWIDISGLAKGIYFVKVFCKNDLVTEKFIKQ